MRVAQPLVCLLALAGGIYVVFVAPDKSPASICSPSRTVSVLPQKPDAISFSRSMSRNAAASPTRALGSTSSVVTKEISQSAALAHLSIPMTFEPNVGQADREVQFIGRGKGLSVFLTREGIAVQVPTEARSASRRNPSDAGIVTLRVADAKPLEWEDDGEMPGQSNYFVGNDPKNWHTRVPHYERAETRDVLPGVGMAVYGSDDGVEYDLVIAPGGDISKLRLTLAGANDLRVDAGGDLLMNASGTVVRMKKPKVYEAPRSGWHTSGKQRHRALGARRAKKYSPRNSARTRTVPRGETGGGHKRKHAATPCISKLPGGTPCPGTKKVPVQMRRREIDGGYVLEADGSIGFRIGPHDPGAVLVVDPSLSVSYATFLGGSGADTAASIAVDGSGKIYVGGTTGATAFPGTLPKRLGPADGSTEFFVAKIDPTQTGAASLVYLAFLGGGGFQKGGVIAVDSSGDVAITGTTTATDYPVTDTSTPSSGLASGLGNDVAVSEINPAGNALVFSTLFGGSGAESQAGPGGIALGSTGDVYVASDVETTPIDSASPDLPVTTGAYLTTWDGQQGDAFLAVFAPPTAVGGAVVLKYCTYLGTNSLRAPQIGGVAVDVSGNAYIAGYTSNGLVPFPTKNAVQSTYGGGASDAFLMKIAPSGGGANDLVYSTLLGGSGADQALGVALDSANPPNAYVTGTTQSPDFPTNGVVGAYQSSLPSNATVNAFLSVVSQNAITGDSKLAYSTYFGGAVSDIGNAVAAVSPSAVYITGATTSWMLPWRDNLQPFNGTRDAFVAKFDTTAPGAAGLIYVTALGGTSPSGGAVGAAGNSIVADGAGHVYVAGTTTAGDFPTAVTTEASLNGFQPQCASCGLSPALSDAFAAEIIESSAPRPSVYFNLGRVIFNGLGGAGGSEPVAVLNGGDANLQISSILVSGPNASDFSVTTSGNCLSQPILPGPSVQCSFDVVFSPSAAGPENAVVLVSDNAPGSPQKLEILANGLAAQPTASPSTLDFGNQPESLPSQPMAITLANTGSQPISLTSIVEGGADLGAFEFSQGSEPNIAPCAVNIAIPPLSQCVVRITFVPNALRSFNAQVQFSETTGQNSTAQQTVALTGVGVPAAPLASLSQPSLTFGTQNVGSASGTQTITLTNAGDAALNISGIALSGTNPGDFAIVAPPSGTACPTGSSTLAVQARCSLGVQLEPLSAGTKSATLVFTDNAAPGSQQVALSGTAAPALTLQVSPPSLTFAAQSESTTSTPQMVTVANSSGTPVSIGAITISGPNAGDFSSPAACTPNPIAAGKNCQISIAFDPAPTTPGIRTATLSVPTATPPTVTLTGTATQAAISVPTNMNFGSQLAGGAGGTPQPVAVTNSSSGPYAGTLTIASVTKTGANAGDFAVSSDSCTGANTPPGSTCALQVAFKPLQASSCGANGGTRAATLSLNDNAPGSPHAVPLSGTAADFCIATAPGQAVVEPITAGQSATYMLEIDSSAGFSGSAALSCSVPANLLGTCAITTTPASNPPVAQISPGSPGQLQVVVTTTPNPGGTMAQRLRTTPLGPGNLETAGIALVALALLAASSRGPKRSARIKLAQVAALVLGTALFISACGGGGSTTTPADPPGTQPGTYVTTLTATISAAGQPSVTHTFPLSLTVQ